MAEPRTRPPTGRVAFPLIQCDGEEKAGKSYTLAALSGSPRVGRSFMLDLGDGTMDEYASLGDYEILETNGTFGDVLAQVEAAAAVYSDPEKPNLIGVDAGTLLWGLLKAKAERRARSSNRARVILEKDPDADIDVSMTYWNEVKDDWARLLHVLKRFPGIGVVTAQGRYVSKVDGEGRPVRGQQEWSTDVEKTTHSWATALVRLTRDPREARLVGVRSLHVDIPSGGLILPRENTLDHLIFDILGAGGFGPTSSTVPTLGVAVAQAKGRVLAAVQRARTNLSDAEAKATAGDLWRSAGLDGKQEVTETEIAAAIALLQEPEEPEGGTGGEPPAPVPPDAPGGSGAAPVPDPEPPAPETIAPVREDGAICHVCPNGTVLLLEGAPVTADEAMAYLRGLLKPAVVTLASQVGVATNGTKEAIAERIAELWGLLEAPFSAPAPTPEPEPEPSSEERAADELPEVIEVPDGWTEFTCALCGEPSCYEPGLYTKTVTHLEQVLNDGHVPEEPF